MADPGEDFAEYMDHLAAAEERAARDERMYAEHEVSLKSNTFISGVADLDKFSRSLTCVIHRFEDLETNNLGWMGCTANSSNWQTFRAFSAESFDHDE